jgi:EAL domain-containing protein (putative c-di-GMP-specific phosphodiesterase class I)/GGDEF domain-containing protein
MQNKTEKLPIVSRREVFVLVAIAAALTAILIRLDAFEEFYEASRRYEAWELDEIIVVVPVIALIATIFSLNRWRQLRRETVGRLMAEQAARRRAEIHPVTGLPNEQAFTALMAQKADARHDVMAIAVISSNHWRIANLRYGSTAAEAVATDIVGIIRGAVPAAATLGSIDTGSIVIAAPGFSMRDLRRDCLDGLLRRLEAPLPCGDAFVRAPVHIGVADHVAEASGSRALYNALEAVIAARQSPISVVMEFDQARETERENRQTLLGELREAISTSALTCAYQPIFDLASRRTVAFEALARWRNADGHDVPPDVFVALAAEAGLARQLTRTILFQALQSALSWPADITVSVNISRDELAEPGLVDFVKEALVRFAFPASRLQFELTETEQLSDAYVSRRNINQLRRMGIRIAIDDFGAGFSNLHVLHEIEFDTIKVDRSFVMGMINSPKDRAIIASTVALAGALGRSVTVEGVETEQMRQAALQIGCTQGQGYLVAKPMDAADVAGWLRQSKSSEKAAA